MGGELLEGPRVCGKTSTALKHARSSVRLDTAPDTSMNGSWLQICGSKSGMKVTFDNSRASSSCQVSLTNLRSHDPVSESSEPSYQDLAATVIDHTAMILAPRTFNWQRVCVMNPPRDDPHSCRESPVYQYRVINIELALSSYHYRENAGLEVKPGQSRIEQAELNLITLRDARVDTAKVGLPAFPAIITGIQNASTRPSCLLYTSPSPRDRTRSRMPSSA